MAGRRATEASAIDHLLGPAKRSRSRGQRWRDWSQTALGLGLCVGAVWWWGWKYAATHAVTEAITAGLLALYAAGRTYWARRTATRSELRRRSRGCSCDTCQRLRAEALAGAAHHTHR